MKIGIDISQIVHQGTGVARFTEGLVNSILEFDRKNQWLFLFYSLRQNLDKKLEIKIKNRGIRLIKLKLPPTLMSFFWNQLHFFPLESIVGELDWFISSDWTEPPVNKIKKTTIVHDLAFIRYPETIDKTILKTQKQRLTHIKKECPIIFADTQATKKDLINFLKIRQNRVVVNYPAIKLNLPNKKQINFTLNKYNLKKPFILTVGKIEPRKNLKRLIEAFIKLKNRNIGLVIVGPRGWQQFSNETMKQCNNVKFLGYIDDTNLYSLYSSCLFFIYPSIWEGFGYPLVEAMKIGAPIVCSNILPFKEIAKDSALYFDPFNIDNMTNCINTMIQDNRLRKKMIESGKIRAKEFSWKRYFNTLIKALNSKFQIPNNI